MKRFPAARFALFVLLVIAAHALPRTAEAQDGGRAGAGAVRSARPSSKPAPSASVAKASPLPSGSASALAAPSASVSDAPELAPSGEPVPSGAPSADAAPSEPASAASVEAPLPAASAEVEPKAIAPGVAVRFADESVFAIRVPHGGRTAEVRAADATKVLARAGVSAKGSDVRVQRKDDVAVVLVGQTPVVQLVLEDATAAGDATLDVHAASVAASIRDAIDSERKREAIARLVLSISVLIFLGIVVFYVVQKIGEFARRARLWIEEHGEKVLAVRIRRIEVVSPGTVRSTALIGLSVGKWIAQVAVVYVYVVYGALARFEATRAYSQRLTGLVVSPLSDLLARIAVGLPMLVVLAIAGFAVFVLVRFVGLYFSSVGRRENVVAWIPPDLVAPVSSLVRFGIVVTALVFLVPLVTGSSEGALARSGWVVVVALGLAATPVLANGFVGAVVLFARKLRAGQYIEVGAYRGRISAVGLLEFSLDDEDGVEIRVPHLYALARPTRVLGMRARYAIELPVAPSARQSDVRETLSRVATEFDAEHQIALASVDSERALYRLSFASERPFARSELTSALFDALQAAKIPLGRLRSAVDP